MQEELTGNVPRVDFVINVFERTYREILQPGQIQARIAPHGFPFQKRVVLINNVDDRNDVVMRLAPLLASGEITDTYFIEDRLSETLRSAGVSKAELKKTIHYTDCSLVAIFLPGSPYLLYSDADVHLLNSVDWITPALQLMQADRRIAIANPDWTQSTLKAETREMTNGFALGYGFSDQLYLLDRKEFARPIYRHWVPISWRYPLSHLSPVFEQRVDSYMRLQGRLRATSTNVRYGHLAEEGQGYPAMSTKGRFKRKLMTILLKLCQLTPGDNPRYHI